MENEDEKRVGPGKGEGFGARWMRDLADTEDGQKDLVMNGTRGRGSNPS